LFLFEETDMRKQVIVCTYGLQYKWKKSVNTETLDLYFTHA